MTLAPAARAAMRLVVTGAVQGSGFRPHAWRLARSFGLAGTIRNTGEGVVLELEGAPADLDAFARALVDRAPPAAGIRGVTRVALEPTGVDRLEIAASDAADRPTVAVLPDLAPCPECLAELRHPADRRHNYPFLNCTACGPRLSIVEGLPYDRANTVMRGFTLCAACAAEYGDPADRRFHAQPIACPVCGPRLTFSPDPADGVPPLAAAVRLLEQGGILALKGVGGYQVAVDARRADAVAQLRLRKGRVEKPFAVMFPDVAELARCAKLDVKQVETLTSPAAPIVLVERRAVLGRELADNVAPGLTTIGAMLPSSPLHHLLLRAFGGPLVMTSGNLSEEPMATDAAGARERLGRIPDGWLEHDRPIARPVDDSVVRLVGGEPVILRRARGYAPRPIPLAAALPAVRALGGHLKNAVAWSRLREILVSQHIGDLDHPASLAALARAVQDFESLYRLSPAAVACDLHPDYATTRLAEESGLPVLRIQHHHAHVAAVMAEHDLEGEVLGIAWDGTGFGPDGTVWGGEVLRATRTGFARVARLLPFPLPGGDAAARQPWRSALGALARIGESGGPSPWALSLECVRRAAPHRALLEPLLAAPRALMTSSAGRLWDAVAAVLDVRHVASYEAQAAMELEQLAARGRGKPFRFEIVSPAPGSAGEAPPLEIDWRPALAALVDGRRGGADRAELAARFTATLAEAVAAVAVRAWLPRVVLAGGCFANAQLRTLATRRLRAEGFTVYAGRQLPPGDGGLAAGQALVAASRLLERD